MFTKGAALSYLKSFPGHHSINKYYDDDSEFASAILSLDPNFEYPEWDLKPIRSFIDRIEAEPAENTAQAQERLKEEMDAAKLRWDLVEYAKKIGLNLEWKRDPDGSWIGIINLIGGQLLAMQNERDVGTWLAAWESGRSVERLQSNDILSAIKKHIDDELDRLERDAENRKGQSTPQEYWDRSGRINAFVSLNDRIDEITDTDQGNPEDSHFGRFDYRGVFVCESCGHRTRAVLHNRDDLSTRLCDPCYQIAGLENSLSDGIISRDEYVRECNRIQKEAGRAVPVLDDGESDAFDKEHPEDVPDPSEYDGTGYAGCDTIQEYHKERRD